MPTDFVNPASIAQDPAFTASLPANATFLTNLEATLDPRYGSYGFHVYSSVSEAAVGVGAGANISFDTCDQAVGGWQTVGPIAASSFTVPAGGAGVYAVTGFVYFAAVTTLAFLSINIGAIAQVSNETRTEDRITTSGVLYLAVGDVVTLRFANFGGGPLTPTLFAGDAQTPRSLSLGLWRVSRN